MNADKIRNIAIIAHVDHGKTSLVDHLLKEGGAFRENQEMEDRVMDSMDLEREKGITIKAKNTAIHWNDYLINIVDTPGHADFGAEVERVMQMVDGVLLLVDAYEGTQAQTRFVLRKALAHGLKPVLVINKVDRENSRPEFVKEKTLELLLELEADDDQFDSPVIYGSAKQGWANHTLEGTRENMDDLFEAVIKRVPAPTIDEGDFRMLVSNIEWDDYVGRVAVGKVLSGEVRLGDTIYTLHRDGTKDRVKVTKVFEYSSLKSNDSIVGVAGTIVGVAGFKDIDIGETVAANPEAEALPFVEIDPPTIQMEFAVNDGPFAGKVGKKVTSRQIRERLHHEMKSNISILCEDTAEGSKFLVSARGAMQIAVLVETMRREGFEVLVSRPQVIFKEIDGERCEPFENLWVELPKSDMGSVMENLSNRKADVQNIEQGADECMTIHCIIPTRGLIGFESDLVNMTSGFGILSHSFESYAPYCGHIQTRQTGVLVSMDTGVSTPYSLDALQARGKLFIAESEDVYVGMIVGENPRLQDLPVNPTKTKQLTNHRASGKDKAAAYAPPIRFSLERAIEYIGSDEYVEATPALIRMRKRTLDPHKRKREDMERKADV